MTSSPKIDVWIRTLFYLQTTPPVEQQAKTQYVMSTDDWTNSSSVHITPTSPSPWLDDSALVPRTWPMISSLPR